MLFGFQGINLTSRFSLKKGIEKAPVHQPELGTQECCVS
jgi:hypothetical protein